MTMTVASKVLQLPGTMTDILLFVVTVWLFSHGWVRHKNTNNPNIAPLMKPSADDVFYDAREHDGEDHLTELQQIKEAVPDSTLEERLRFLTAKKGNVDQAIDGLQLYVRWNQKHSLAARNVAVTRDDDDWQDWEMASIIALTVRDEPPTVLPRVARTFSSPSSGPCRCRQRHDVVQIYPGMLDERVARLETYSLAIAIYLNRKLPRDSLQRITVLLDARGGVGWRNPHVVSLISFIQHSSTLLLTLFPERLARAVVFPVPYTFGWIWHLVQRWLDPLTASKIGLLTGPARIGAPAPTSLAEYLDPCLVEFIEAERQATFVMEAPANDEDQ